MDEAGEEGGHRRDHHHVTCHIGEAAGLVAHGEVPAVDVETSEIMVLGHPTASIRVKTVSGDLLIVILRETMAG